MPRIKPTEKLGVYGKYDLDPADAVEKFVESKAQNKYYIKPPYWDVARDGIEFAAVQNEREFIEMQKQQREMRQQAQIDCKLNEKRVNEMYTIQEQLRAKFISVNEFIRDCQAKEQVADEKIANEREKHRIMKEEISKITHDLEILNNFHEKLKKTVNDFKPYEDVIEEVVAHSDLYKNVKDLIDRCDALMIAQVEITEMEREKIKSIEEMRVKMVQATNEAALTVMGLNNKLAELERNYNTSKADSFKWGQILAETKTCIAEKESLTFRLLDQIQQLYVLFCRRNGQTPMFSREQIEQQMDFIKEEINYFQDVLKCSHDLLENEKKSEIAQQGSIKKF